MNNKMKWLAVVFMAALAVDLSLADSLKGRILGEQCAKTGKIGECPLKWAEPMVFWMEDGNYFHIKLAGKDLDQVSLDKAFGQEVQVEGKFEGKDKDKIRVSQLTLLNPPGKKEFFKG